MKNISIALLAFILLAGCASKRTPPVVKEKVKVAPVKKQKKTTTRYPTKPKKHIRLKKVEDANYSSTYMYPKGSVKKAEVAVEAPIKTPIATNTAMNKEECIAMISQEKFDKYTEMFGSEAASIKRCNMIKAMNHQ